MPHAAALAWAATAIGPVRSWRALEGGMTSSMLALTTTSGQQAVLRLMDREPWRTHGEQLTTREAEVQRMLADTRVPAPRSLALDADGGECGHPAHLMTFLPGDLATERADRDSLDRLAELLADVHAVAPTIEVRAYQSWAWEAKYVVPGWAEHPSAWQAAFDVLRGDPPDHEPTFLHRDFAARNVLWDQGRVTGLVDWVETSIGPAWLDVAHGATNLAVDHGEAAADAFAAAYVRRTGRPAQPYFDVMDVVGFLPPPGRASFFPEPARQRRLEEHLVAALGRL